MFEDKKVTGIILIAGDSTRLGKGRNKNFELVNGRAIFQYSLEVFCLNKYIDDIIIAIKGEEKDIVNEIINKSDINFKNISLVIGGKTRDESVYNCIKTANAEIVVIHDGARPLIKDEYITKCLEEMKQYCGCCVAVKSKDTVKITDENGIVINTTERKNTWIVQTPQCFDKNVLIKEIERCDKSDTITDECMLLELAGYKIKIVAGDYKNIKLTNCDDIKIIEQYLNL